MREPSPYRYNDHMDRMENALRNVLSVAWSILIGADYILAQTDAATGLPPQRDPVVNLLQQAYIVLFCISCIILAYCAVRRPRPQAISPL